jgi:hypothetical protein
VDRADTFSTRTVQRCTGVVSTVQSTRGINRTAMNRSTIRTRVLSGVASSHIIYFDRLRETVVVGI